jgi:argininosuccinate synthase
MQEMIDASQESVNGVVQLGLYKGNVIIRGRNSSSDSLFDQRVATFEADGGIYHQSDAEGFIQLNALRLRIAGRKRVV